MPLPKKKKRKEMPSILRAIKGPGKRTVDKQSLAERQAYQRGYSESYM